MRSRILPFAAAAFLLVASKASAYVTPGPLFAANGYSFSAGLTDRAVFGDLNRDGLEDLVFGEPDGLAIAFATGAGSFAPYRRDMTDLTYATPVIADFDGDGALDIGGSAAGAVFVEYVDGNGGVSGTFELAVPGGDNFAFTGDLDGDGRADLVTLDDTLISVFLAQPNRTLTFAGSVTRSPAPASLAVADVVGSPAADLLLTYSEQSVVEILPGNADGTFGPATFVPTSSPVWLLRLGRMDAGASLDLVLQSQDNGIQFGANQGGGAFGPFSSLPPGRAGFGVLLGDYNRDDKLDVLADAYTGTPIVLQTWLGDGTGGFGPHIDTGNVVYKRFGLVQGDIDGDGNPDVAGFNATWYTLILSRGNGDGTFGQCPPSPAAVAGRLRGGAAGDFDGDGKVDAVGFNDLTNKLAFARGRGDGTFDPIVESSVTRAYTSALSGRFDGDAALDLVAMLPGTLSFFHGNGDGTFAPAVDFALGTPSNAVTVDLNADGKLDVVVPCANANALYQFLQGPSGLAAAVISPTPAGPVSVRFADLNADGRLDRVLACTNLVVSQVDDGLGGYTTVLSRPSTPTPDAVELGDVDEDGKLDLVFNEFLPVTTFNPSPVLHLLKGLGGGSFGNETTIDPDYDPETYTHRSLTRLRLVDLDEDGHLDLLGADQRLVQFDGLRGRGDGTFAHAESYLGPWMKSFGELADFNGDAHLDLLSGGAASNLTSFTVFLNRTGGVVGVPPARGSAAASIELSTPFPNPARASFTLRFSTPSRDAVAIDVISVGGRHVLSRSFVPAAGGAQSQRIEGLDRLAAGVYAVVVSQGEKKASTRLVVLP